MTETQKRIQETKDLYGDGPSLMFDNPDDIQQLLNTVPLLVEALELAVGRLTGHANSTLYDAESKWAAGVLTEIDRILGESK